ncbi:MAG: hypothetical protein ACK5YR_12320 [Pirellula sp.]|jgi:hypothetical protein
MSEIAKAVEALINLCQTISLKHDLVKHELASLCLSEQEAMTASNEDKLRIKQQAELTFSKWSEYADSIANELKEAAILADERGVPSDAIWEAVLTVRSGQVSDRALGQLKRLQLNSEPSPDWVSVRIEDCDCNPTTLFRKSKDPDKTGVRTLGHGEYQIQRERLTKILKQERLHKYQ